MSALESNLRLVLRAFANVAIIAREESALQDAVGARLLQSGIATVAQARVHDARGEIIGRLDFLCFDSIGVELKTKGGLAPLLRQLDRYATAPQIEAQIVITTRRMLARLPASLRGKPLVAVMVGAL